MKKVLLIDGHSILNRAFYGLPDLTNSAGIHTGAVYGFITIMQRFISEEEPDYITVAFDVHAPTFRHEMYADYKGTRHAMPEELRSQVPMIRQLLEAMGITIVKKEGLEADDILGTLSKRAEKEGCMVTIVSGDRDLLQLATDSIKIAIPKTKAGSSTVEYYFASDVKEQKGVTPEEFIDVKALWGDTADNIPGVTGIGEKTATAIIQTYHTVENAYEHADEIKPPRASKNLKAEYDTAILSKKLATIVTDADVDWDIEGAVLGDIYTGEAFSLCREWEFKNLLSRFEGTAKKDAVKTGHKVLGDDAKEVLFSINSALSDKSLSVLGLYFGVTDKGIAALALSTGEENYYLPGEKLSDEKVSDIVLDIIGDGNDAVIAMSDIKDTLHVLGRAAGRDSEWLLNEEMPPVNEGMAALCKKLISAILLRFDKNINSIFDMALGAYILNPLLGSYSYDIVTKDMSGDILPSYEELFGKKGALTDADREKEAYEKFCIFGALSCAKNYDPIMERLEREGTKELYLDMELPLIPCIFDMECAGIGIDADALSEYGKSLLSEIERLEKQIYEAAGEKFNINSPKQLGVVLFENLKLPGGKKTKTGYSTAADVLEKLSGEYPIVSDILSYRQHTKLKSTYADGLAGWIAKDGRIHTCFKQTVTATGRLSSTDPNLQNIPIRLPLGRAIRKVFLPKEGCLFADADYSQIELRVLAALSGDERLIEAYRENKDIHRATAALVFHKDPSEVTDLDRRNAKAVNFGIVYGISSFGLGEDLGIGRKEAQQYIDDYFVAYPGLKRYLDELVAFAKENGYALTKYMRRRPVPELSSGNFMQRSFGERVAMNAPVQGTAADIIKLAMLAVWRRLRKEGLRSRLILQVHDELLIEADRDELQEIRKILGEEMRGAAQLSVPLEIGESEGENWYEAK